MANDILKEAIADAKAVREVALANAKAALEEAFTPQLQSMLSAKLSEELNEEEDLEENTEEIEENYYEDDPKADDVKEEVEEVEEATNLDEEIDLEEILNELELEEGEEAEETVEEATEEVEETIDEAEGDEEELEEAGGLNQEKPYYTADNISKVRATEKNIYEDKEFDLDALLEEINNLDEDEDEVNESEEPIEEAKEEEVEEAVNPLANELEETKAALETVQTELNEVNLLNSKLLYVNRIFKANNLDEGQKLRVVETLDKAESAKEAKLIYETIKDTFDVAKSKKESVKTKTKSLREGLGMASKAAGLSTAPKKEVISESKDMVSRFQKLANIKINQ
jgi:hypothetical protein